MITLEQVRRRAEDDAKSRGYSLNYDESFLVDLLQGLRANEVRLGYPSCPCRMASGNFELDRDIICPCDYRDPDVLEHGACYCALFISNETAKGRLPIAPVPERRPPEKTARAMDHKTGVAKCDVPKETAAPSAAGAKGRAATGDASGGDTGPGKKLWYCKQCGYVAFREEPPYICPVCKAKRELFAEIALEMRGDG